MNPAQWGIVGDIIGQQPIRHFSLKSRQVGVSTFWLLWWLDECIFEENVTTGILAHKWESLEHLWSIVELAYNTFSERLPLKKESAKMLEFAHNNSKIFISLSIRSIALHNLHISEWCWCKDEEIKATLGATSPLTNISGESTGNGVSNDGYQVYQDAKLGQNEYRARFIAWFIDKGCRIETKGAEDDKLIMNNLNKEESDLRVLAKQDYSIDIGADRILFRRQQKRALKDMFPQEYPEKDEDAFITSGEHYFNLQKALALYNEAREWHKNVGCVEKDAEYQVFERPEAGCRYAAGVDTSEGITDYNVIKIVNVTKRKEAFVYRSRCGISKFYRICNEWGRAYNNALLGVEDNNTGHAVLLGLDEDCRYANLYKETNKTRIIVGSSKIRVKLGWHTDKFTRAQMLVDLKDSLEGNEDDSADEFKPEIVFYDLFLLTELFDFVKNDKRYESASGKTDDVIFASGIAMQMYYIVKSSGRAKSAGSGGVLIGAKRESKL